MNIALYYLCGVYAAAQLGKLAALAPLIARDLALGLAAMAALTSLLEVCGALFGGGAGRWLPRLGLRRGLSLALLSLAAGSLGAAFAGDVVMLTLARLLESVGYLVVVVAAPVLIARASRGGRQAAALALWSTFVPVGMALGAWVFAQAAANGQWRAAQAISVVAGLVLWMGLRHLPDAADATSIATDRAAGHQPTGALIWALVAAFGAYAIAEVGLLALLPSLLTLGGQPLAQAGRWTALAALANVPASALGAWLLRRAGASGLAVGLAMTGSLALSGLLYLVVFRDGGAAAVQAPAAVLVNLCSGVFPCLVFALLPLAAGHPDRLALASGRLTQFGASGALLGPPLMGTVVERWGWTAAGALSAALSLLAIPLALFAWRRLARHPATVGADRPEPAPGGAPRAGDARS